eukprot:g31993.t1
MEEKSPFSEDDGFNFVVQTAINQMNVKGKLDGEWVYQEVKGRVRRKMRQRCRSIPTLAILAEMKKKSNPPTPQNLPFIALFWIRFATMTSASLIRITWRRFFASFHDRFEEPLTIGPDISMPKKGHSTVNTPERYSKSKLLQNTPQKSWNFLPSYVCESALNECAKRVKDIWTLGEGLNTT